MMESSRKVVELFVVFAWIVEGSIGSVMQTPLASPPLAPTSVPSAIEGNVSSFPLGSPTALPPLTPASFPPAANGTVPSLPLYSPTVSPPQASATLPPSMEGSPPSSLLHFPVVSPAYDVASPPLNAPAQISSPPPRTHKIPVASSPRDIPQNAPAILPVTPVSAPQKDMGRIPVAVRIAPSISPVQGGPLTRGFPENPPAISPVVPEESLLHGRGTPPTSDFLENSPAISPVAPGLSQPSIPDSIAPPASAPPTSTACKSNGIPVAAPPNETLESIPPVSRSPSKGFFSDVPPSMPNAMRETIVAPSPYNASPKSSSVVGYRSPASSPSNYKSRHPRNRSTSPAPASYLVSPPSRQQDHGIPPAIAPKGRRRSNAPSPRPSAVPPTGRPTLYAPPPFSRAVPPNGRPTHHAPPPFLPAVPPRGRPTHHAPPPFLPAVPPRGMPEQYAPRPFPSAVHNTGRSSHYAPTPLFPVVSPTGRPIRFAPPTLPPAGSPTGRPTRYAPPPFLPAVPPRGRPKRYAPSPLNPGSSSTRSPVSFPPSMSQISPGPSLAPKSVSGSTKTSFNIHLPRLSPSGSSPKSPEMLPPPPTLALPPPPPNEDCSGTICTEPLTNTPPGSPCACVWPMQVGLSLSVDLYTFFPLVSEFAAEIAAGVFMKQSQVRIMGANAASQQPEETVVLVDLVPFGERFDNGIAFSTFQRFWSKEVDIKESNFGDYEVLYVRYQGLPPSPPLPPSSISMIDDGPYSGNDGHGRTIKPLGVDVGMKRHKRGISGRVIAIVVLSAFVVVVLCSAAAWVLLFRRRGHASRQTPTPRDSLPSLAKSSGATESMIGSVPNSVSLSFGSSIAYTGSAKTYSIADIDRATNNFDESRILGEGGFGRVYSAVLDDGTKAAVKVLKRDDQQGGREFLAEVEMLTRLHHRNLVKLIGISTEERARCLVYELIPNGSVESHLHGVDKESAPVDWAARMKIALGAARGLAYLHEDSSPRVIHRDFKSSNILLEHDFTPKVSDFGLARTALDENGGHISTRVMGTFGYVAPEYAMTGHLLVKSDVYSYGVVLLELLTGRKPVDMSQPPGQENLVAWARPLLASNAGLDILIDSTLKPNVPLDSVAKVAAIASMCVEPEVSRRPFMGEVVQALKLVCDECNEANEINLRASSRDDLSINLDRKGDLPALARDSGFDPERGLSVSELLSASTGGEGWAGGSFGRVSSSGPVRTWRRVSGGNAGEHGTVLRLRTGSY